MCQTSTTRTCVAAAGCGRRADVVAVFTCRVHCIGPRTLHGRASPPLQWLRVRRSAGLRPTILDRYVVREVLPPIGLGLLLFTFILVLDQISQLMKILVSRGADLPTVVRAFLYLLPSIFSVTIPMAFLLGVLLAFGRMASDSEIVALRASGVSPLRLLRPVVALSALAMGVTFFVVAEALPAANQAYRELIFSLVVSKAKSGMQPRVFNDDLIPGMVIYVSDIDAADGRVAQRLHARQPRAAEAEGGGRAHGPAGHRAEPEEGRDRPRAGRHLHLLRRRRPPPTTASISRSTTGRCRSSSSSPVSPWPRATAR